MERAEWRSNADARAATNGEELVSFRGPLGGPETRPFLLHPAGLSAPERPIVGAAQVHAVLAGWRAALQGDDAVPMTTAAMAAAPA